MSADLWFLDSIRDAVNSPETADPESLREASVAYNDACRAANARLREVDKLLQRGLRSEAIQAAEQEPTLLEFVGDLEFPMSEEWQGMLAQWGLPLPPSLEREIAARLNAAYAELQPLEQLMRQHRLLALVRAPLTARIQILRRIAKKDDVNFSWKSDLLAYERQRIREIRTEATDASRRQDLPALTAIQQELNGSLWLCEVPQDVVHEVEGLHHSLNLAEARKSLEQLGPQLHQAYGELDSSAASRLSDQWEQLAVAAELDPSDPVAQVASEALDWVQGQRQTVEEQRAFQKSLDAIEQALDEYKSLPEIETLFHKAERFGLPIPELLRNRVAERLGTLRANSRRRGLLIGVTATAAAVVLMGATAIYWHAAQRRELIAQHTEHLKELVDQAHWDQAAGYLEKMPESVQDAPEVIALEGKVKQGLESDRQRAESVEALLVRAEEMDPADPDQALLGRLQGMVSTPTEQQRFADVELNVRRARNERQKNVDEAFLKTVQSWSEKLADLESSEELEEASLWPMLRELELEMSQHSRATADLKQRGASLANKLRAIINQKAKLASERKALKRVFDSVGDASDYVGALEELVETQPDSLAASHARQLLDEQKAWQTIMEWAAFWEHQRTAWAGFSPDDAAEVLKEGDRLQADTQKNEMSLAFADRKAHLEAIVARKEVDLADLKSLLVQNALVSGVWLVIDAKDQRYYCPKEPVPDQNGFVRYEYFIDYTTTKSMSNGVAFLRQFGEKPYLLSPQSQCAEVCAEKLAALEEENWDSVFGSMALSVRRQVEENPAIDEVLAMDMLRNILKVGGQGSLAFSKAFGSSLQTIENSGIDLSVAWFLPGDKDAATARIDAAAILRGLEDFGNLWKKQAEFRRTHCQPPGESITWVAVLDRLPNGSWVCQPSLAETANGSLLVAATSDSGEVVLEPLAQVQAGSVAWDQQDDATSRLIGAPLFLRQDATKTP